MWSSFDVALELMVAKWMMSLKSSGAMTTELMVRDAMWVVIQREAALVSVMWRLLSIIALFCAPLVLLCVPFSPHFAQKS